MVATPPNWNIKFFNLIYRYMNMLEKNYLADLMKIFFKGFSQILVLNNATTGALILIAILVSGIETGNSTVIIYAISSAILSPLLAYLMRYPKEDISNGIWGYNAILYGIALSIFIPSTTFGAFFLIIGNIAIVLLTPLLTKALRGIPVLTMPFILATWGATLASPFYEKSYITATQENYVMNLTEILIATITNYIEIFLLVGVLSGLLVMLGIFIANRTVFYLTLFISISSVFLSRFDNTLTIQQIIDGMYGYNVILTAIATFLFRKTSSRVNYILSGMVIMLTLLISHFLTIFLSSINLPLLTLPFVVSTWLYLLIQEYLNKSTLTKDA
ncbi:urea transporter [Klebsiella aerogenes]|nr:urea transporter [Klebsiella aerogenes]ELY3087345.1 urea transporter [Klebsiella aerogenes]